MIKKIPQKIKKNILEYKRILNNRGFKIFKIIVFGSVAKGTNDKHSDIDLAVVSPKFGKDYSQELSTLMQLRNGCDIEPHPYNPKDLNNKFDALANEIKKYGVEVK